MVKKNITPELEAIYNAIEQYANTHSAPDTSHKVLEALAVIAIRKNIPVKPELLILASATAIARLHGVTDNEINTAVDEILMTFSVAPHKSTDTEIFQGD